MFRHKKHASFAVSPIALFMVSVAVLAGSASQMWAVGLNYVEANDFTNLTPASAIDSFNAVAEPDNLWDLRSDFGLGLNVFQASGAENAPELTQLITGLTPGNSYDVYAVYQTDDDENWTIRTGVTPGNLTLYSFTGDRGPIPVAGSTQGLTAGAAVWDTLPPVNKENTIFTERPADTLVVLLGKAGTTMADASGQINVLIDDFNDPLGGAGRRTWLDGVAYVDAGTPVAMTATLDRATGAVTVSNPTATAFQIKSISLVSVVGGLDATSWTPIAGWTATATPGLTAEYATDLTQTDPAMTGTTIAANGGSLTFANVWNASPFEDVLIRLTRTDNEIAVISPQYSGPTIVSGDLDANGSINLSDFQTLLNALHTTPGLPTRLQNYRQGELTGDGVVNFSDWAAFRAAFDAANGAGAFEAMLAQVPEPGTLTMLLAVVAFGALVRRRSLRLSQTLLASCLMLGLSGSALAIDVDVDIDSMRTSGAATAGPIATQSGFTSWDLTNLGTAGSTIRLDGITFELFGLNAANQSRIRLTGTPAVPNGGGGPMNDLLADFVFNEGANGRAIGLRMTNLPVGSYDMQSWHFDATIDPMEATEVEVRDQGQMGPGTILATAVPWGDTPIEFSFDVTTPGQVREVIFRESSAGNRARLNGFTLFSEVPPPPIIELTLQVNTSTGAVSILNEQSVNFDMSYYEIRSPAGALNLAGWTSLDDAETGDPLGDGWDEATNSSANILSEVNLQSMATFEPQDFLSLGNAFSVGGAQNLRFYYAGPEATMLREGLVSYVTTPGIPGDFNEDGKVDAADYVVWRKTDGTPTGYNLWRTNFGRTSGSGSSLTAGAAVPEPSTMLLGAFGLLLWVTAVVRDARHSKNNG
jgi:hypothetical protein